MKEIWKPVVGYEGLYEISNIGRVKSLNFRGFGRDRISNGSNDKDGYLKSSLTKNGISITSKLHRLVAIAFLPNPENKKTVNHINGIKSDNSIDNLEWATQSENIQHAYNTGLKTVKNNHLQLNHPRCNKGKFGKDHNKSVKVNQFTKDGTFIKEWDSMMDVKRTLGISDSNISACCRGKLKTTAGFIWKYL